ncbi:MAG TPA: glucuronate isomerase [Epulopiscium sp.]|nr:glucuronate isomerase [Candidatus Epulonipiscium sp.]
MKKFMDENFLLQNETAIKLYHDYAKDMPIMDYHCHLSPQEIWEDKQFKNITEVWLGGDHYKWRAMRLNGIPEKNVTGDGNDYDKFMAFAQTLSKCIGNPLYHWTHLELQRYFDVHEVLNEETAPSIWEKCNAVITSGEFSARKLIEKSNVKMIGTTDDPIDSLEYHQKIKDENKLSAKVLPTFRPDKGVEVRLPAFIPWVKALGNVVGIEIKEYSQLLNALEERAHFFHEKGCRMSDHGIASIPYVEATLEEVEAIFTKGLAGQEITDKEEQQYKTYTLKFIGKIYAKLGWVMQLHMGALRNNSAKMFDKLGADVGFDSIDDIQIAKPLSNFLDSLQATDELPKTILYTLNPVHNYVLGTMLGNFSSDTPRGKIQFGSGWWFNDQKDGMISQMKDLANLGLLGNFVGMLTDSRSFLSYTRHEYFRRILCNLIGEWVENGEFPNDEKLLSTLIKDISFNNAEAYFAITQ